MWLQWVCFYSLQRDSAGKERVETPPNSDEARNTSENEGNEDREANASDPSPARLRFRDLILSYEFNSTNGDEYSKIERLLWFWVFREFLNTVYDRQFEKMGLPIDPHIRFFKTAGINYDTLPMVFSLKKIYILYFELK